MQSVNASKRDAARVMFITSGVGAILLFLLWNPLVLRPRFWNARVVMRTLLLDEAVVLVGVGLILLRRWAALLASVMAVYLAIYSARSGGGVGAVLTLSLLTPLLLTLLFWRDLVWGARWGDLLLILATLILNGMIVYAAFLIRMPDNRLRSIDFKSRAGLIRVESGYR